MFGLFFLYMFHESVIFWTRQTIINEILPNFFNCIYLIKKFEKLFFVYLVYFRLPMKIQNYDEINIVMPHKVDICTTRVPDQVYV